MYSIKELIDRVIIIGRKEIYQEMEFVNSTGSDGRLLWDHKEDFWKDICIDLSTEDIIALLRSLVYADGRFDKWTTYSAMHYCFYLLCILSDRLHNYQEYLDILNWVFKNRRNSYIPYICGNIPLYVTSIEEYRKYSRACEEEYQKRQEKKKQDYEEAQIRKKERRESAIKNKENNEIAQLKRKNDREIFLSNLKTKTQLEVFRIIIADNTHSIYYYPDEYSCYNEDIIKQLSLTEKQILINKLNNSRGSWRILRQRIKRHEAYI